MTVSCQTRKSELFVAMLLVGRRRYRLFDKVHIAIHKCKINAGPAEKLPESKPRSVG
jgi:hypothetical protein